MYLACGLFIAWVLVPTAFREVGLLGGLSYVVAILGAISNATFFRVVKIGRGEYIPLGLVAPTAILIGVIGAKAISPLLGNAKDAAMAQDFIGAAMILGVFLFMRSWLGKWKSGNPYQ